MRPGIEHCRGCFPWCSLRPTADRIGGREGGQLQVVIGLSLRKSMDAECQDGNEESVER